MDIWELGCQKAEQLLPTADTRQYEQADQMEPAEYNEYTGNARQNEMAETIESAERVRYAENIAQPTQPEKIDKSSFKYNQAQAEKMSSILDQAFSLPAHNQEPTSYNELLKSQCRDIRYYLIRHSTALHKLSKLKVPGEGMVETFSTAYEINEQRWTFNALMLEVNTWWAKAIELQALASNFWWAIECHLSKQAEEAQHQVRLELEIQSRNAQNGIDLERKSRETRQKQAGMRRGSPRTHSADEHLRKIRQAPRSSTEQF
jgi:hypothetical protein